jgi:choline dehydrogenase-like flavoprotein
MNRMSDSPARVVVVGGGFAGMLAARRLAGAPVKVTILDRGTTNLFQPLLYQCATGLLSEGEISIPLRSVLRATSVSEWSGCVSSQSITTPSEGSCASRGTSYGGSSPRRRARSRLERVS